MNNCICSNIFQDFFQMMQNFAQLRSDPNNSFTHNGGFQPTQPNPLQSTPTFSIEFMCQAVLFTVLTLWLVMGLFNRPQQQEQDLKGGHGGGSNNGNQQHPGGNGGGVY